MLFTKLRLTGFKSFVDATELVIDRGITGIVGPNGCGKSNLVEALRWVMGESSAKRMRGGEMDDVIFGGTQTRPARNLAHVVLEIDNGARKAPAVFNDTDLLEISRKIERGAGSDYRVNGRSVRARDVQLLFQDASIGANSPAMVSQGRVGVIITAKPADRRMLLEEAAGIMGLHSRRHEAELRLRSAETNLTRLDDVIQAMETQNAGLNKQVRQAQKYRDLTAEIRRTEALLLHVQWLSALQGLESARAAHAQTDAVVGDHMLAVTRAASTQADAAAALPPLRERERKAAEALQGLVVRRDALDLEARRVREQADEFRRRLDQVDRDGRRERDLAHEAGEALTRFAAERERIALDQAGEAEAEAAALAAVETATAAVAGQEAELTALTEAAAELAAQRDAAAHRVRELDSRLAQQTRKAEDLAAQRTALEAQLGDAPALEAADAAALAAEAAAERARDELTAAESARRAAEQAAGAGRDALREAQTATASIGAEAQGLRKLLASARADTAAAPLIDAVQADPGVEGAVGAALGEAGEDPIDPAVPTHWRDLPPLAGVPDWPPGIVRLSGHVQAPPALARRLALSGLATDVETALAAQPDLSPGQMLVTRDGAAVRWDGHVVMPGAPSAAAIRLQQRNRLAELEAELAVRESAVAQAQAALDRLTAALAGGQDAERTARQAVERANRTARETRDAQSRLAKQAADRQSRLAGLVSAVEQAEALKAETATTLADARTAFEALPAIEPRRAAVSEARASLAEARTAQVDRQSRLDQLRREGAGRRRRLETIAREEEGWRRRADGAAARLEEMDARAAEARGRLAALELRPAAIAEEREQVAGRIVEAERARAVAADALVVGETTQKEADRTLKTAEAALTEAREARVRAEAEVEAAQTAIATLRSRITERLEVQPDGLKHLAEIDAGERLLPVDQAEGKLAKLIRTRDALGPVNLRAEVEAEELQAQIDGLMAERAELTAAIDRLRSGINQLNKEARERLVASFDRVDRHFQELFVRLFGGGRAHLKLTDADDPLNAGLEVFASPPGKRLQSLSLLSGGEQALTAVALLFAVFLTNPAPICVLDEVDAPLDDANVDRFCTLLEEIADAGATRFLVITHHRMTMARVDRLFGVTMRERGVSQLVSVDLGQAETIRAA